jgi:hypothetical protein
MRCLTQRSIGSQKMANMHIQNDHHMNRIKFCHINQFARHKRNQSIFKEYLKYTETKNSQQEKDEIPNLLLL